MNYLGHTNNQIKTDYLTLLAFLILHPASHGKSARCLILREIKYAQMFLHRFVCRMHFPTVQKHTGIETIPHFNRKNDKGVKPANGIQPAFWFRGTRSQLPSSMRPSLTVPGDFWDAACAFCSPRKTCPTDSSSVGGPGRELSAEQADNLHEPCLP